MKRLSRIVSILMLLVILGSQSIYAEAAEAVTESPSTWAMWDVQMAYTYGLGNLESYKLYASKLQGSRLLDVEASFEEKFAVIDQTKVTSAQELNRGEVIKELYDVIQLSLKLDTTTVAKVEDALAYFVANGLIKGRINGGYALDKACTQEEMLVFSARTYEYLTYTLDLDAKGAFWKVSDQDNTVYLLGSVHVTDGSVYPMSKDILAAFTDSEALAVEANILVPNQEDVAYMQQKVMIEGDGTIDKLISKENYEAYVAIVKTLGIAPEVYNKLKPWYAATLLQTVQLSKASYSATMGIDMYFLSMAYNVKPIIELESIKFQVDMLDSFTPELQEANLESTLKGDEAVAETNAAIGELLTNWKTGNVEALEKQVFAEEGTTAIEKELNNKMWETRNKNMLDKVAAMLTKEVENDYFVVVGAGHMLNEDGLVQGLKDLGYTVEQVK